MKPVYFPFTYVTDSVVEALAACFGQFVVYQPLNHEVPAQMQLWVDKGIMDIRVPVTNDAAELELKIKNYLNWANQQLKSSGSATSILKTLAATLPFCDPSLSSQIVTQVKEHDQRGTTNSAPGALWEARIFLYFAQEFDRQTDEIERGLGRYRQKQEDLIRVLKMEEDPLAREFSDEQIQTQDTSVGYMISDRLEAWTRLMQADAIGSSIFITHSPKILELLLDKLPTAQKILHLKSIPLVLKTNADSNPWQPSLMSFLIKITKSKWPVPVDIPVVIPSQSDAKNTATLTFYLVPDQNPTDVFCQLSENKEYAAGDRMHLMGKTKNTLLGLIEL